jgi:hypothetical protein
MPSTKLSGSSTNALENGVPVQLNVIREASMYLRGRMKNLLTGVDSYAVQLPRRKSSNRGHSHLGRRIGRRKGMNVGDESTSIQSYIQEFDH